MRGSKLIMRISHWHASDTLPTNKNLFPFLEGDVPYVGNLNADGTKAAEGVRTFSTFKGHPEADFDNLNL